MARLVPICALLLLVAACAGPEEEDAVALDEEAAQTLAEGAQRLAGALDDEDACAAMAEADAVNAQARDGVASGTVPPEVANQVEAVTTELTSQLTCEPDEPDGEDEPDGDDEPDEPEPEPEPDDPPEDDPPDEDQPGKGPEGEGPPGQAQGGGPGPGAGKGGGR